MEYKPIDIQTQFKEFKLHDDASDLSAIDLSAIVLKPGLEGAEAFHKVIVQRFGSIHMDPNKTVSIIPNILQA